MKTLEENAVEVIKNIEYLNISTITPEGLPWGTPVYTAYDNDLNFYYVSWKENQHSKNIKFKSNAFVTIYDSTVKSGTGFGVYLTGTIEEVTNPLTIGKGILALYKRAKLEVEDVTKFLSKYPRRVYMLKPTKVWVNGDKKIEGSTIDTREEISLEKIIITLKE